MWSDYYQTTSKELSEDISIFTRWQLRKQSTNRDTLGLWLLYQEVGPVKSPLRSSLETIKNPASGLKASFKLEYLRSWSLTQQGVCGRTPQRKLLFTRDTVAAHLKLKPWLFYVLRLWRGCWMFHPLGTTARSVCPCPVEVVAVIAPSDPVGPVRITTFLK